MSIKRKVISRAGSLAAALAVVLGALVPALTPLVSASSQVQTRSIEMSDATPSHSNTSYKVTFTPATTNAASLVIDFCSNSSIIGGACTAPLGLDANGSIGLTVGTNTTGWVVDTSTALDSASTVTVKNSTGSALGTSASDFTLTGITNPSGLGTFWARIYTYAGTAYGGGTPTGYVDPTDLGTAELDYGGFALSTTTLINITATVMETLTFCTSKSAPGPLCTATDTPNLTLGHGSPSVLDSTQVDTDTAHFQISTNALTGAVVRMKSHNACANGGLSRDGGTTCPIVGLGTTGAGPTTFTAATALFGMHVTTVAGGTGTVAPELDYDGTTSTNYGLNGTAVTSTYGDPIANTSGTATASVNELLTFGAQASVTTPAGVYSVNESLIATGTF
jgi:hypothetical protein